MREWSLPGCSGCKAFLFDEFAKVRIIQFTLTDGGGYFLITLQYKVFHVYHCDLIAKLVKGLS